MARYVSLNAALLSDPAFEQLSPNAERAWFRLRLDPRVGVTGIGRMTIHSIAKLLDVNREDAVVIMDELRDAEGGIGIDRDDAAGLIWFRGGFRHEPNSPQLRRAAVTEIQRIPYSPIVRDWCIRYRYRFAEIESPKDSDRANLSAVETALSQYSTDTVSEPSGYGIDTPLARAPVPGPGPVPVPGPGPGNHHGPAGRVDARDRAKPWTDFSALSDGDLARAKAEARSEGATSPRALRRFYALLAVERERSAERIARERRIGAGPDEPEKTPAQRRADFVAFWSSVHAEMRTKTIADWRREIEWKRSHEHAEAFAEDVAALESVIEDIEAAVLAREAAPATAGGVSP